MRYKESNSHCIMKNHFFQQFFFTCKIIDLEYSMASTLTSSIRWRPSRIVDFMHQMVQQLDCTNLATVHRKIHWLQQILISSQDSKSELKIKDKSLDQREINESSLLAFLQHSDFLEKTQNLLIYFNVGY